MERLEVAEASYIKSFHLVPTTSHGHRLDTVARPNEPQSPTDFVAPRDYYKTSTGRRPSGSNERLNVPIPEIKPVEPATPSVTRNPQSKFVEVNRNSSLFSKRFSIGQRIKVNEEGQYVSDPSPESEGGNPLGSNGSHDGHGGLASSEGHEGLASSSSHQNHRAAPHSDDLPSPGLLDPRPPLPGNDSDGSGSTGTHSSAGAAHLTPAPGQSRDMPPLQSSPSRRVSIQQHAVLHPGAERRAELHQPATAAAIASARPSHEQTSPLGRNYDEIRDARARLKALNGEIAIHQQQTFSMIAKGEDILGWLIVGRSVRWLPYARLVEGRTREDILWENVGKKTGEAVFWTKTVLLAILLGLISELLAGYSPRSSSYRAVVPFIGLSNATAPGFGHYLGFLKPLARSNGFGSGVAEGLAPALALSIATGIAVFATHRTSATSCMVIRTDIL